ncbi:MAG: metal-binding protein [Cyanobacteria bacterium P01_D01_bin.156]
MPSGKNHDRITLWLLPVVLAGAFMLTLDIALTVLVSIAFLIGGFMMGPDLDIQSVQYRRWGPIRWIWYPYQVAVKHRSVWSHGPLIGTILRVVYLALWIALFTIIGIVAINHFWQAQLSWSLLEPVLIQLALRYWPIGLAILVGLELGALSHYTSDWLVSSFKRQQRRKK